MVVVVVVVRVDQWTGMARLSNRSHDRRQNGLTTEANDERGERPEQRSYRIELV